MRVVGVLAALLTLLAIGIAGFRWLESRADEYRNLADLPGYDYVSAEAGHELGVHRVAREQAESVVRDFLDTPNLSFERVELVDEPNRYFYELTAPLFRLSSEDKQAVGTHYSYRFLVEAATGRLALADMSVHAKTEAAGTTQMSMEDAEARARSIAERFFPEFNSLVLTRSVQRLEMPGPGCRQMYSFIWRPVSDWRVLVPQGLSMRIDSSTGGVMSYQACYRQFAVSTRPEVPRSRLRDIIGSTGSGAQVDADRAVLRVWFDDEEKAHLIWQVGAEWDEGSATHFGTYLVDAHSGGVLKATETTKD